MTATRKTITTARKRSLSPAAAVWAYGVLAGTASDAGLARLPRLPDGGAPRAVPLGDGLAIVVADVPREPFEAGTLEARLRDLTWVGGYASAHHGAIERLAQRYTLLPLRLFTVFDSDARAVAAFGRSRRRLAALAKKVDGRAEWVLRVHRPAAAASTRPTRATPANGTAFLRARADAQQARVAQARAIETGVLALLDDLSTLADEMVERAVEPGTSAIAEAAFLVGKRQLASFRRALTRSSASLRRDGCRIALTGPWPVYSFVDVAEAPRG